LRSKRINQLGLCEAFKFHQEFNAHSNSSHRIPILRATEGRWQASILPDKVQVIDV
jgi:hypothetical protein